MRRVNFYPKIIMIFLAIMVVNLFNVPSFALQDQKYNISKTPFYIFNGVEYSKIKTYDVTDGSGNMSTCILSGELENYGYTVKWDPLKRETKIEYTGILNTKPRTFYINNSGAIYNSDVKTYLNGEKVTSYNTGGYSLIPKDVILYAFNGYMPSSWALRYYLQTAFNDINSYRINIFDQSGNPFQDSIRVDKFDNFLVQFIYKVKAPFPNEIKNSQDYYAQVFNKVKEMGILKGITGKTIQANSPPNKRRCICNDL